MTKRESLNVKSYARNPHVRFDEGEVASAATSRRGALLYVQKLMIAVLTAVTSVTAFSVSCYWQEYDGTYEGLFSESGRWRPKIPGEGDNVICDNYRMVPCCP